MQTEKPESPCTLVFLPWDSQHFGFAIGRVLWNGVDGELRPILARACNEGYRLLYVQSPIGSAIAKESAGIASRIFETARVEFAKPPSFSIEQAHKGHGSWPDIRHLNASSADVSVIRRFGVLAGRHSRFFRDHGITRDAAQSLFEQWAERSLSGELADATYGGFSSSGDLVAFIALRTEADGVRITLLSVMPQYQGRGFGTAMVRQAESFATDRGAQALLVATSAENTGAVSFYQRMGFRRIVEQSITHVWLE
ncbi:hypothetical protein JCM17478_35950 [Thermopirellula anaerolimosa]